MNSKNILFSFLILVLALIIVSAANAIDNETVLDDNTQQDVSKYPDLKFEQSYDPTIVHIEDVFEVYLNVHNTGLNTYHNLTVLYPLPNGLELLVYPPEYTNNSIWAIDTLYPNELSTLTLVCLPKIANTTYEFAASVDGQTVTEMDIYCEDAPIPDVDPDYPSDGGGGMVDAVKSMADNPNGINLKDTANPIFLLLFTIIFIPYIRLRY